MINELLQEQIEYYQQRAPEYDEWFYRIGRYDRGAKHNQRWFDEVKVVQEALNELGTGHEILELACGTGIWTQKLLALGKTITAIDVSAKSISLNKRKVKSPKVKYQTQDLFEWEPDREYDLVVIAFWLSHVPPQKFDEFLDKVAKSVRSGGRLFIVDSRFHATATAKNHDYKNNDKIYQLRKLNNGDTFKVIKIYHSTEYIARKLSKLGFQTNANMTDRYFIYAVGEKL
ncbi:MAG: class I SAM-dependent methyltransferase [Cyanobacteriota bacterium]|nr:class I SAM-dependent methyltransferase [Cyanobacteriota bacterium]